VRRATTLVEALVAISMVAVLFLGAATLFGFVFQRASRDTTETAVYSQACQLSDELTKFISQAKSCDLQVNGTVTGLRCIMPANGVDTDQDGLADEFTPSSYDPVTETETFTTGKYVWFYMSSSAGTWGAVGTFLWRASPATSANPALADLNTNWAKYYGGSGRWNFIDSVTYTLDAAHQKVTYTISASSYNRAERSAAGEASTSDNTKTTITRTVFWRSYRN
jgi:hypothetical protein